MSCFRVESVTNGERRHDGERRCSRVYFRPRGASSSGRPSLGGGLVDAGSQGQTIPLAVRPVLHGERAR